MISSGFRAERAKCSRREKSWVWVEEDRHLVKYKGNKSGNLTTKYLFHAYYIYKNANTALLLLEAKRRQEKENAFLEKEGAGGPSHLVVQDTSALGDVEVMLMLIAVGPSPLRFRKQLHNKTATTPIWVFTFRMRWDGDELEFLFDFLLYALKFVNCLAWYA